MPKCASYDYNGVTEPFVQCKNEATHRLWCPTWINAQDGVMCICDAHAKVFRPELNPHAAGGEFHWEADADEAFAKYQAAKQTK